MAWCRLSPYAHGTPLKTLHPSRRAPPQPELTIVIFKIRVRRRRAASRRATARPERQARNLSRAPRRRRLRHLEIPTLPSPSPSFLPRPPVPSPVLRPSLLPTPTRPSLSLLWKLTQKRRHDPGTEPASQPVSLPRAPPTRPSTVRHRRAGYDSLGPRVFFGLIMSGTGDSTRASPSPFRSSDSMLATARACVVQKREKQTTTTHNTRAPRRTALRHPRK